MKFGRLREYAGLLLRNKIKLTTEQEIATIDALFELEALRQRKVKKPTQRDRRRSVRQVAPYTTISEISGYSRNVNTVDCK